MRGNARARVARHRDGRGCGAGRSDSTAVQRDQGVEMCARGPCATTAACSWRRACAMTRDSDGHGAFVSGCAAQGVPCKRAGRRAARKARSGGTQPMRRNASCARYAAVLPSRGFARSHQHTGCGQALGLRHTGRRRLRCAVCEERGRELDAMEPCALRTRSPLLHVSVHGHGCGQRTRERRWRRGCVSLRFTFGYVGSCTFYLTPRLPRG